MKKIRNNTTLELKQYSKPGDVFHYTYKGRKISGEIDEDYNIIVKNGDGVVARKKKTLISFARILFPRKRNLKGVRITHHLIGKPVTKIIEEAKEKLMIEQKNHEKINGDLVVTSVADNVDQQEHGKSKEAPELNDNGCDSSLFTATEPPPSPNHYGLRYSSRKNKRKNIELDRPLPMEPNKKKVKKNINVSKKERIIRSWLDDTSETSSTLTGEKATEPTPEIMDMTLKEKDAHTGAGTSQSADNSMITSPILDDDAVVEPPHSDDDTVMEPSSFDNDTVMDHSSLVDDTVIEHPGLDDDTVEHPMLHDDTTMGQFNLDDDVMVEKPFGLETSQKIVLGDEDIKSNTNYLTDLMDKSIEAALEKYSDAELSPELLENKFVNGVINRSERDMLLMVYFRELSQLKSEKAVESEKLEKALEMQEAELKKKLEEIKERKRRIVGEL